MHAAPIQRLIAELGKLPGIGERTATRLAFNILRRSRDDAEALAEAIRDVKERIGFCEVCFNLAEGPRCRICTDGRRDPAVICVVEEFGDVCRSSARTSTTAATTCSAARSRRSTASTPPTCASMSSTGASKRPTADHARW